jgi:hypothetical protein
MCKDDLRLFSSNFVHAGEAQQSFAYSLVHVNAAYKGNEGASLTIGSSLREEVWMKGLPALAGSEWYIYPLTAGKYQLGEQ